MITTSTDEINVLFTSPKSSSPKSTLKVIEETGIMTWGKNVWPGNFPNSLLLILKIKQSSSIANNRFRILAISSIFIPIYDYLLCYETSSFYLF
ncbi:hypothetical protein BLOT_010248 [Blomia tropicalis]|nr:hypothetical protein BLOT_010248 [Blomia tropicalis]